VVLSYEIPAYKAGARRPDGLSRPEFPPQTVAVARSVVVVRMKQASAGNARLGARSPLWGFFPGSLNAHRGKGRPG
jgi:hypothetical protein